ncbi:DUF4917 family protein [Ochrobactrum sp. XJ1]|nr:DUF4917 family protein [Ochrobactrum sp. XJ1]
MPDIISFEEAISKTENEDRALLIGNGFSAQYFNYASLLSVSGIEEGAPLSNLFSALKTVDFESVVRAIEGAVIVERAYGNEAHARELEISAQEVREALVQAINNTHPAHREDLGFQYESSAKFLDHFDSVYSLNYDLLLYWVNLEKTRLRDGFGLGTRNGKFLGPFSETAHCELFNIHGGLHLFDNGTGDVIKALDYGGGVIETITNTIQNKRIFPIYVAEGTSMQKMQKINSSNYLRYCYDKLTKNAASIFIYGHSADENDAHIYKAIFKSKAKHIYFGVYQPDKEKLRSFDGLLAKYQKTSGSDIMYTFFDSQSANVWAI